MLLLIYRQQSYHNYHIFPGSTYKLDLRKYFSDPDTGDAVTQYSYGMSNSKDEHAIINSTLILDPNMTNIVSINAYDIYGGKTSQPITVTSSTYDPFGSHSIYANSILDIDFNDIFGTSASLDYSATVAASVYHDHYLRFTGLTSSSKIKITAVDHSTNEIYVDDLNLTVMGPLAITNSSSFDASGLFTSASTIEVVSSSSNISATISGSIVTLSGIESGTGTITLSADHGKQFITIPVKVTLPLL